MKENFAPTPESLLTPLQELVDHCVKSGLALNPVGTGMKGIEDEFGVAAERFKLGLLLIRLLPAEQRERDIRLLQHGLTEIMDIVDAHVGSDQLAHEQDIWRVRTRTVGGKLYLALEGLLFHIEHYCKDQFDYDVPLCTSQRNVWMARMQSQLGVVHDWFAEEDFLESLRYHIMVPYYEVLAPASLPLLTFREWMYLATLLCELENMAKRRPEDAEETLLRTMIRYNFNCDPYLDYCIQHFEAALTREDLTDLERLARTLHYQRLIEEASPTSNLALLPHHEALHLRLMRWVDRTHSMYGEALEAVGEHVPKTKRIPEKDLPRKQRVGFVENIEKLAVLHKVLIRLKIFLGVNDSEMCRHLAYRFSTKGALAPAWKNVKKAFENPSEAAYQFVIELCHRMIREVEIMRDEDRNRKR